MLFSSYTFLFQFLPATVLAFAAARRHSPRAGIMVLAGASLFFYGAWRPIYLLLLVASIAVNFGLGLRMEDPLRRRTIGAFGVALNLGVLCYFKYTNFIFDSLNTLSGVPLPFFNIILPLGISFFTFQNIVYINGVWSRKYPAGRLLDYASCIVFFPHLIAGPIVLYQDLIDQFQAMRAGRFPKPEYEVGGFIFVVGLFKKLVLADSLAPVADAVFSNPAKAALLFQEAWFGALAYTFQIYFDFSGYSDMAIGLGLLFGVRLPLNFFSPYKATNIIDFWHTWHMTLSRFLREYVYIPLGGNRRGRTRRYVNLMLTMFLGGRRVWEL